MTLPLYRDIQLLPALQQDKAGTKPHMGLLWERFFNGYVDGWIVDDNNKQQKEQWASNKQAWLAHFDKEIVGDSSECEEACLRLRELADTLGGQSTVYQVEWRFVTGTGLAHPMENGFLWHPTLGTPYLPGSTVKGLLRSWMQEWAEHTQDQHKLALLYRWFGSEDKDPTQRRAKRKEEHFQPPTHSTHTQPDTEAGSFIFFDALPVSGVTLKADVITPHMGKWYEKGDRSPHDAENTPSDWHSPNPIGFLTVQKPSFQFTIAPRHEEAKAELNDLMTALDEALTWLGVGAKTAVGYGQMSQDDEANAQLKDTVTARKDEAAALQQKLDADRELAEKTADMPDDEATLYRLAQQSPWKDNGQFVQMLSDFLDRHDAPSESTLIRLRDMVEIQIPGLLTNPDATKGKQNKPLFKPRQIDFAKRINQLTDM